MGITAVVAKIVSDIIMECKMQTNILYCVFSILLALNTEYMNKKKKILINSLLIKNIIIADGEVYSMGNEIQ